MLDLRTVSVGPMDNRCYLLTDGRDGASGAWLLVDAAAEPERLLALLEEALPTAQRGEGLVVTTHRHDDHTGALAQVAAATGATTAAGDDDADAIPLAPDRRLKHGDVVTVGAHELGVTALRGHTPGSVALLLPPGALPGPDGEVGHLFTGDSLFPGGPGKTWSPEDFTSLMDDLEERVFAVLPDSTVVHPGHGETTTIGAERPRLGEYRARGW
ncbi:Glyoxylase, beta-lactamase superfamily II [Quadrisphaera granulorum]|uniref:Glyoxylase-like metal-dependent hydrolase (Beta-lactamase superfamily II) n=1 Tax=Quadrisphaera granulorum TaxID=317664 RepID=A0A316AKT8_9ACTN|nr:MBL fold metallo-hydrolase [Quadrisphaera granulorum]PWJ50637.1 glyoxylase-like metal-dependent hydrolase (beta-lactamase superfamily II) [Quadrisphaera granulorum]SZE97885.1 Glyoxylase, beta-lactamase superfamily II [Quadrisphaera granulorum]